MPSPFQSVCRMPTSCRSCERMAEDVVHWQDCRYSLHSPMYKAAMTQLLTLTVSSRSTTMAGELQQVYLSCEMFAISTLFPTCSPETTCFVLLEKPSSTFSTFAQCQCFISALSLHPYLSSFLCLCSTLCFPFLCLQMPVCLCATSLPVKTNMLQWTKVKGVLTHLVANSLDPFLTLYAIAYSSIIDIICILI